uniref:Choline/Carnitine o-acyltransferase n=1 Tax=Candidatus Kentrum sp. SD TaxID=2126332 RepID=A0A450Z3T0_9GAMM|nr:MAG: Choline/Carnitine o-acyltransferase [Candidatus Kentron sp. SD]VFK48465.1 MAG: Choline/Carnitine o-acyltransferase [Candidatus Kentron sp. SD]
MKPLVPVRQFAITRQKATAFLGSNTAKRLQKHIERYAADPAIPNWFRRWRNDEFLADRNPPGIFVSPVFAFTSSPSGEHKDQITQAATITHAATRFFVDLKTASFSVDYYRGKPLCMDDYKYLMGAARIPMPARDIIVPYFIHGAYGAPHHIVVMCGGRIFRMEVLTRNIEPIPAPALCAAFREIRDIVDRSSSALDTIPITHALGALTFLHREQWVAVRGHLIGSSHVNRLALHTIESALFVVSLDDTAPPPHTGDALHHLIHGLPLPFTAQTRNEARNADSVRARLAVMSPTDSPLPVNRWWDKTLQIHVARNGYAGLTFEHSMLDSLPPLRLCQYVREYNTEKNSPIAKEGFHDPATFSEVHFEADAELSAAVLRGSLALKETIQRLALSALRITQFGSWHLKSLDISPDAFVQMGLQIAFQEVRGFVPNTCESVSIKAFLHGRTERLRVVNEASQRFVEAFNTMKRKGISDRRTLAKLSGLLRQASAEHVQLVKQARTGNGFYSHFTGLMFAAREQGIPLPNLFTDASFHTFSTVTLSTTHPNPTPGVDGIGFGPVSERCIGVGYFVFENEIILGVSSWREKSRPPFDNTFDDSARFTQVLAETFAGMRGVLEAAR